MGGLAVAIHPRAGTPAQQGDLIDVPSLIRAYYTGSPDPELAEQRVSFGTSGHRGSPLRANFNECHLVAIAEAVGRHRASKNVTGPLFLGADSHALSEPAKTTVIEVLAAHGIEVRIDSEDRFTPTPAVSHAILEANRGRRNGLADGIVITPSHNPPEDGGIKYNPPSGGPAGGEVTAWIESEANRLLDGGNRDVARIPFERARCLSTTRGYDYVGRYVAALPDVLDVDAIRGSGLRVAVDPLGGAALPYWKPIAEALDLDLTVVSDAVDPRFAFMTLDWDARIRMDCSSPHAMASVVGLRDHFDIAFSNDTDADRYGIVTKGAGLLPPNNYLAVAAGHLFAHRSAWADSVGVGKTIVTSALLERIAGSLKRPVFEVPVGFKWFVDPLLDGTCGFVGEESAGASFLRRDGTAWTTDKDGILLNLLAVEATARAGRDLGEVYHDWTQKLGEPHYARIDVAADADTRAHLGKLSASDVTASELAGEAVEQVLTNAPGNDASIGGLKVTSKNAWFAARPSGTEPIYKIYAESFLGSDHLARVQEEAEAFVARALL